ncbi:MAG: hypothetical protein JWQ25_2511, partial [Daejeonella sp.]|nr:hypothetical protein [Daejeonella sp.]
PQFLENWDSFEKGYTYVLIKENASLQTVSKSLKQISKEVNKLSKDGQFSFVTEPLSAITPGSSDIFNGIGGGTSWMKVYIESGVALILLLAACFNYVNLTIARALTRAKEVGIRKVNGASRYQIFAQYVIESVLIALFALGVALIILSFVLRYKPFNDGYEMIPNVDLDYSILIIFVSFTVIIGMLAGSFPAWILSAFKPVRVLKNISTEKLFGNISLQRILIVFQFSLSLVIIIFLSAFYRQFSYLGKADYGFRKDNLITIPLNGNKPEILINALAGVTGVEKIAAISDNFGSRQTGDITALYDKEKNLRINLAYYFADQNIVPVMDLKIKAGENLPITDDQNKGKYLLVNEKAVLAMGYKMNEAIGKMVWLNDTAQATITGVVQDFYYRNPGISPQPMALINNITDVKYLTITVSTADRERLVSNLKSVWQQVTRQENFTYNWFDEYLEESSDQTATISLLGYLAFMAVSIASLGLFGLVIYTIETRRKEISVRKVIGASVNQLMVHLSRNFVKLLLISGAIAMPLGYILSRIFLQNFSSRVNFGVESVLACFILLLLIGLLTIISQTFKAARENPVKNLRNE